MVRLGDLIEITSGFAFEASLFTEKGGLPLIRIRDVKRGFSKTNYIGEYSDEYLVNTGDLLIGMDGEFNSKRWTGGKALLNQRVCKIVAASSDLHEQYLYYFLPKQLKQIEDVTPSVTVKHLSVNTIKNIEIPLPSLEEQKRIAAILDKADAIRRKRQQAIALTDQFLRSVFLELFGDPVTNPNEWKTIPLDEIAEIHSGITKGRKIKEQVLTETPYMRVANVQDGFIQLNDVATIAISEEEKERYKLLKNDILLTEGGDPDKLGRGAVWHAEINPCIHQNHIFRVRIKNLEEFTPYYLSTLIGSQYGKRYFLIAAKQTTGIATINKTQLKEFPILVPPIHLQKKFSKIVERVEMGKQRIEDDRAKIDKLIESLTQRAFPGDLNQVA